MFRECLCVVARQLAPKCRDFSNVAKLGRQCKWPYRHKCLTKAKVNDISAFEEHNWGHYVSITPCTWSVLGMLSGSYVNPGAHCVYWVDNLNYTFAIYH